MMLELISLQALHALAFVGLVATSAMRLYKTNCQTLDVIRLAVWALFCTSVLMLFAPIAHEFWPDLCAHEYRPTWVVTCHAWAVLAVQYFTGKHWKNGVPRSYTKPEHLTDRATDAHKRRSTDS